MVGSPDPQEDAGAEDRDRHRDRARRQPGRSHRGSRHQARGTARRPPFRKCANGIRRSRRESELVLFSPDGSTVVSTNRDKTVTRWDVGRQHPSKTLRGHSNFVQQPVFSPDGETLYTVSHDGTAIAWDLTGDRGSGGRSRSRTTGPSPRPASTATPGRLSPDGRLIAVGLKGRARRPAVGGATRRGGSTAGPARPTRTAAA